MDAYEDAINATSTEELPWYIIPADKKWFTRLAISEIIVDKLKSLDLEFPVLGEEETAKLSETQSILLSE